MSTTPEDALRRMREAYATLEQAREAIKRQQHWGFYVDDLTWIMGHLQGITESIAEQVHPKGHEIG